MLNTESGRLLGLRLLDENGTPSLTCGRMIEDPNCLADSECHIKEFNLHKNQRIVGFKCDSGFNYLAQHVSFKFFLMAPITKLVLLKLLANKTKVSTTDLGIGKLPEGVLREVIRFVRY